MTHDAPPNRRPFAVQAALFSLYSAPVAVVVRSYATATAAPSVARHVGVVTVGVVVVGLVLGVAALVVMARAGRRRVLARATLGLIFNAAALATPAYVSRLDPGVTRWGPVGPDRSRLVGTWWRRYVSSNGILCTNTFAFNADGTFHETYTSDYGTFGDWTGHWSVEDGQLVEDVDPADVRVGHRGGHHHGPVGAVRVTSSPVPVMRQLFVRRDEDERHFFRK